MVPQITDHEGIWDNVLAYVSWLVVLAVIGVVSYVSVTSGVISPGSVTVSVEADLGWVVEYGVAGLAALILLFLYVQIGKIAGTQFLAWVTERAASVADSYRLPGNEE